MSIGIKTTTEVIISRTMTLAELFVHLELEGFCDRESLLILLNEDSVTDKKNYAIERLFEHGTKFRYIMAKGERRKKLNTKPRGRVSHKTNITKSISPEKKRHDINVENAKYIEALDDFMTFDDDVKQRNLFDPITAIKSISVN